jgi:site-specific recombinase XerC
VTALAPTLQAFFTDRLLGQRGASGHTIAGYRDTWRLLLSFAAQRTGKNPCQLDIADLDAPLIAAFLDHLEHAWLLRACAKLGIHLTHSAPGRPPLTGQSLDHLPITLPHPNRPA